MADRGIAYSSSFGDTNSDNESEFLEHLAHEEHQRLLQKSRPRRVSIPGRLTIVRDRYEGHQRIYRYYFAKNSVYPPHYFRRRFRMRRELFCRILNALQAHDDYFVQKQNNAGTWGLSSLQKMTAAIRILAYGCPADSVDEYVQIGESTALECLRRFVRAMVEIFSGEYLRSPTEEDTARLLQVGNEIGFPGMLGSIDCMHWKWKNCPTAWSGTYTSHIREPTIILEAVASKDLWIWHAFFGLPGSLNDINVLQISNVFQELATGRAPKINYTINGHNYTMGYYLADGIYPSWPVFVKSIPSNVCIRNKKKLFVTAQESARKDVERAFGVLQSRFAIVRGPARMWDIKTLKLIMKACIIMHNMIVEDERNIDGIDYNYDSLDNSSPVTVSREETVILESFIQQTCDMRDRQAHSQLQDDLIEHIWNEHGEQD